MSIVTSPVITCDLCGYTTREEQPYLRLIVTGRVTNGIPDDTLHSLDICLLECGSVTVAEIMDELEARNA